MRFFNENRMHRGPAGIPMYKDMIDDIENIYNSTSFTYSEILRQGADLLIAQWKLEQYIKAKRLRQSKRTYCKIKQAIELIRKTQNNALEIALNEEKGNKQSKRILNHV